MKTLYLIDGHAQLFRAYHAIRTPMSSPVTKEPTNATFGFVGMILKLLRQYRPDYVALVVDAAGDRGTFRSQLYADYKATREEPPESLGPQVDRCVSMLQTIGMPVIAAPEVEADDSIATIVHRLAGEPVRVRIISKDKDLQQLLGPTPANPAHVEMIDVHTDEVIDAARLLADKGITPEQVIDFLALMGDTADNVPGVEGVGPKTAAQLIQQYGSLDNLMARADEVKGKRGESLRAAAALLPLSRRLVTLRTDVPMDFDLEAARVERLDLAGLQPALRELGFNRYQEELKQLIAERAGGQSAPSAPAETEPKPPAKRERSASASASDGAGTLFAHVAAQDTTTTPARRAGGRYETVATRAELESMIARLRAAPLVAFDTETTGLSPLQCALCGLSFSVEEGAGWYVPVRSPDPASHLSELEVLKALRPVLEDANVPKCGHNAKFDILVLRAAGVRVRGLAFDSMVGSYLVDASRSSHGMDALAQALLGYTPIPITDLIGVGKAQRTFDTVPLDRATEYAAEDADVTLRLHNVLHPQVRALGLEELSRDLETPLIDVLAELEWNGVRVDPAELDRQAARLNDRIAELRRRLDAAAPRPFNPDSPRQLQTILFNLPTDPEEPGLGLKAGRKTKTGYSTDIEVLEKLAQDPTISTPVPALIVEHRQLTRLVSTYLVALKEAINPKTGRVHASFNQTVAATGRLSSSDPNLQNIPIRTDVGREIRRAFVAPPGRTLVAADYSQIELRILAHLSRDEALIDAFRQGQDIHRAVAAQINAVPESQVTRQQRDAAKMVNFGIVYGVTPYGLARRLGIGDKEAAKIIDDYRARFPGITTFLQECVDQARRYGYVETMLRRRRPIPQIMARNPNERSLGERMAINSVVQGSAADLIKLAMLSIHREMEACRRAGTEARRSDGIADALMLLQIHDELLFEASVDHAEAVRRFIVERMESAMALLVPLKVDSSIAPNWFEGK